MFQTPMDIPLKIHNMMTLKVSAAIATLSRGMRRRKRETAERKRLIAAGKKEEGAGKKGGWRGMGSGLTMGL